MKKPSETAIFCIFFAFYLIFYLYTGLFFSPTTYPTFDSYSIALKFLDTPNFFEDYAKREQELDKLIFAPFTNVVQLFIFKYFGTETVFYRLFWAFIFSISSFFTYLFCKKIAFSWKESLLVGFLLMIGRQGSLLWEINTAEPFGLPFLAISLYFSVCFVEKNSIFNFLALIFSLVLLSFSKESFVLLLPAFAIFLFLYDHDFHNSTWKNSVLKIGWLSILILLFSLAEVLLILKNMGSTAAWRGGKVGVSLQTPVLTYLQNMLLLLRENNYLWYFLLAFLLLGKANFLKIIRHPVFVFAFLLVASQCLLYARGGFQNRYLMPAMFGLLLALAFLWKKLRENNLLKEHRILGFLMCIPFFLELTPKISEHDQVFRNARNVVSLSETVDEVLKTVVQKTSLNDSVLLVYEPSDQFLIRGVIGNYLQNIYYRNKFINFSIDYPYPLDEIGQERTQKFGKKSDSISWKNAKTILIFPEQEKLFLQQSQLNLQKYERKAIWQYVIYTKP